MIFIADERVSKEKEPQIHINELGEYAVTVVIKCWTDVGEYWNVLNGLHEKVLLAFRENNIIIPSSKEFKVLND